MNLTVGEAWNLWWSGQQLTGHALYGVPVVWLGRSGKLLSFLSGGAIVLDIVGPVACSGGAGGGWGRPMLMSRAATAAS